MKGRKEEKPLGMWVPRTGVRGPGRHAAGGVAWSASQGKGGLCWTAAGCSSLLSRSSSCGEYPALRGVVGHACQQAPQLHQRFLLLRHSSSQFSPGSGPLSCYSLSLERPSRWAPNCLLQFRSYTMFFGKTTFNSSQTSGRHVLNEWKNESMCDICVFKHSCKLPHTCPASSLLYWLKASEVALSWPPPQCEVSGNRDACFRSSFPQPCSHGPKRAVPAVRWLVRSATVRDRNICWRPRVTNHCHGFVLAADTCSWARSSVIWGWQLVKCHFKRIPVRAVTVGCVAGPRAGEQAVCWHGDRVDTGPAQWAGHPIV